MTKLSPIHQNKIIVSRLISGIKNVAQFWTISTCVGLYLLTWSSLWEFVANVYLLQNFACRVDLTSCVNMDPTAPVPECAPPPPTLPDTPTVAEPQPPTTSDVMTSDATLQDRLTDTGNVSRNFYFSLAPCLMIMFIRLKFELV